MGELSGDGAIKRAFSAVIRVGQKAIEHERTTEAGRVNVYGTMLAFFLVVLLAIPSTIEWMVRLFRPDASAHINMTLLLVLAFSFLFICVFMLWHLEAAHPRRKTPQKKHQP